MYELIYLAFKTDSTRVATYMIGKELGAGISDYLARAVGFPLTHKLSHETKCQAAGRISAPIAVFKPKNSAASQPD